VNLLLDTCTFIWLLSDERPLPDQVKIALLTADLSLSVANVWEMSAKYGKRALPLPEPPERLIPRARARYGIESLAIDEASALHLVKLPALHADPFDRMLVSQAIVHGLTIVTPDPLVTQYPARTMW